LNFVVRALLFVAGFIFLSPFLCLQVSGDEERNSENWAASGWWPPVETAEGLVLPSGLLNR
jgi:hypothetical protein